MFIWLNKQGVRHKVKGFVVQYVDRFTAEYREADKILSIQVDPGLLPDGRSCELIELSDFEKWDDGAPIPAGKQKEILENFRESLEFQNIGLKIYGQK